MSSHTRPKLTAGEISGLIRSFPLLATTIVAFIWTSSWSQWKSGNFGGKTLRRNAAASVGTVISFLSPRQVRSLFAHTTGEAIKLYCAAHGLTHQSTLVKNDDGFPPATLHFVDCELTRNGPILLYFHGGGFIVPLNSPAYAVSLARTAGASLVLLEYTLAPECVYPGQLSQSIAALRLILQHRNPSEIIIAGESAGGNIALAIMAHLQEPKIGISPLVVSEKFKGLLAISPRTANKPQANSFQYNGGKDFMNKKSLSAITATWKPADDVWAAPVLARAGFWDGLKAARALLVVGENEVYHDDVCHVANIMGATGNTGRITMKGNLEKAIDPAVQLIVCPGEMHCQASLDKGLGITDGHMTQGIVRWLSCLE
ncbi:hypothetical protein N0V93_007333 [Gnomoniopsis smithogilvyi]|uniref:Alpha/beta hydrolase fold-3 domain-containing protein n=1 Tax=Gnomoniopsis smithogilvyi TaxID=1191159 RepID=A0A9W8YSI0_9PEZI|nr:hypothetical protein N0V93_007333 [Gnomoniopsis smithogilvyi]